MILVIEDDDGAAWTVCEDMDVLDLSTSEGKDKLANMVEETLIQIREETDLFKRECVSEEEEADILASLPVENADGTVRYHKRIGYAEELDLETSDAMADEIDL